MQINGRRNCVFLKALLSLVSLLLFSKHTCAETLHIGVASNFIQPIKTITKKFEQQNPQHTVLLSFASTGKLYAQSLHGAPFDLLLAADEQRPQLLLEKGIGLENSLTTYAIGKLVLWSRSPNLIGDGGNILSAPTIKHIAIANPKLAPYGKSSIEVLRSLNMEKSLKSKIVMGENIGQTYQFIHSGHADLGFIAFSQWKAMNHLDETAPRQKNSEPGSYWIVPQELYSPIKQQGVLLTENKVARQFLSFLTSPDMKQLIHQYGYDTPE